MKQVAYVLERIARGDQIRFYHDYFGEQGVELASGRILRRRRKISLTPDQMMKIKDALRSGSRRD